MVATTIFNSYTNRQFAYVTDPRDLDDLQNATHIFASEPVFRSHVPVTVVFNKCENQDVISTLKYMPREEFEKAISSAKYDLSEATIRVCCTDKRRFAYIKNTALAAQTLKNFSFPFCSVFCQEGTFDIPDSFISSDIQRCVVKVYTSLNANDAVLAIQNLSESAYLTAYTTRQLVLPSKAQDRIDEILAAQVIKYVERIIEKLIEHTENASDILFGTKYLMAKVGFAEPIMRELSKQLDKNRLECVKGDSLYEIYYVY